MSDLLLCRLTDARETLRFDVVRGFRRKMVGLLGTGRDARPVALCGCSSVHTLGMRYEIDIALVARDGHVLASRRAVPPGRMMWAPGARYALERPACGTPWPHVGSWVGIAMVEEGGKDC